MIRFVKREKGEWPDNFDKYETNEIIKSKGEDFDDTFLYLEVYINFFEKGNKILLLDQDTGEIYQEYKIGEIEGLRYLGTTDNWSTMLDFLGEFIHYNSTSFLYELENSEKDGWYTKENELRHYIIFKDTQIELLSKDDIWKRNKKIEIIHNKYTPIGKKLKLKKSDIINIREYILEFRNRQEIESMSLLVSFLKKETIKFMGIETYTFQEAEEYYDFIRYTRIYFLLNGKYKITIEYNSLENNFYLILKKEYRDSIDKLNNDIFLIKNENSEFYRKCYDETGFFEDMAVFRDKMEAYTYISDDYILELVIEKNNLPRVEILDLDTGKYVKQKDIFK